MAIDRFEMIRPDDFHLHLRQGEMLDQVVGYTAAAFARAMVMPNISPPVKDRDSLNSYEEEIRRAAGQGFTPLMTFKLMPGMSAATVYSLKDAGAIAGKYYPAGATTNAEDAVAHWEQCREALEAMEELGLVLSIHGEDPMAPSLEREQAFLPVMNELRRTFPRLPMVLEHISSLAGVEWVKAQGENTAATVTLHHLMLTIEDIIGGPLRPHLFCRPLPKNDRDRQAIIDLVLSDHPRVFFGSDSAPHQRENKECLGGAAGIFTAPVLMPLLVQFFEKHSPQGELDQQAIDLMESFTCRKGAEFYGLPVNSGVLTMERKTRRVPPQCGAAVPLWAGRELEWSIAE